MPASADTVETQIVAQQRVIDYDTKEYTVELLVGKFRSEEFVIPEYQREFVWNRKRQARFIESVILGLPIPFMFAAERPDGKLEIIDGAQRIQTLDAFLANSLRLTELEKLPLLKGYRFKQLPVAQQRKLNNRTMRMIVLTEKADDAVRFDIFERINTGSDTLRSAELRKGAHVGPFYDLVRELAGGEAFARLCPVTEKQRKRGEREELVLRFFAYSERYQQFQHDVSRFLDDYVKDRNLDFDEPELRDRFSAMLQFVENYFPYGFAKAPGASMTPRVRFEAIAVGAHLALRRDPSLVPRSMAWLESEEFRKQTTTHGSNSRPRLTARVEYVRDQLLSSAL